MDKLLEEIEIFIEWLFQHHEFKKQTKGKIIHDNLWGTEKFEPHEVFIIDSPLFQRLRKISQTGLSVFTYPSTTHNRFSHSLGVYSQVKKLINSVNNSPEKPVSDTVYDTLKLSALLPDVGHAPFSHSSEEIYKHFPEIYLPDIKKKFKEFENGPKAHEMLSFLITKSEIFKDKILDRISEYWNKEINPTILSNSIVGFSEDPFKNFQTEFINGSFDADKLDYLMRDGFYSGLPLKLDLERLWYSVEITTSKFDIKKELINARKLTIKRSAVSLLEQIVFAKMILLMSFYHHHKVRAAECMYKGIIEYLQNKDIPIPIDSDKKKELTFERVIDFLYTDDLFFQNTYLINIIRDKDFHKLLHNLQYRRLLKRAAIISYDTICEKPFHRREITDIEKISFNNFLNLEPPKQKYSKLSEDKLRIIARMVWNEIKYIHPEVLKEEIWLDIPFRPHFSEAENTYISPSSPNDYPIKFDKFFPSDKWAEQYVAHKYRAHLFCPPSCIDDAARVFKRIIFKECSIKLNDQAFLSCNVKPPAD